MNTKIYGSSVYHYSINNFVTELSSDSLLIPANPNTSEIGTNGTEIIGVYLNFLNITI